MTDDKPKLEHKFCLNQTFEMTCDVCGAPEDSALAKKPCGTCPDCLGAGGRTVNGYKNQAADVIGFVAEYQSCNTCDGHGDLNKAKAAKEALYKIMEESGFMKRLEKRMENGSK